MESIHDFAAHFEIDHHPDEAPTLSDAEAFEPETHSEACTCSECEHAFFGRLRAEDALERERLEATYPPCEGEAHDPASCRCDGCFRARLAEIDALYEEVTSTLAPLLGADAPPTVNDAASWPAWTDSFTWEPVESSLGLAEQVEIEARRYRRKDTIASDFIADHLSSLAWMIRRHGATTPLEFEARQELADRDLMHDCEERGWDAGYSAGLAASL